ncbi:MAG: 5'/3'-nucleotidase SurE [Chlamydiae bacterium]|nr:5'/3'-nucleotidase SurE [Chlamydiota bacterium]
MRPLFLISNDDGIDAPGIETLWETVKEIADIVVVAPATNHSSAGANSTLYKELHAERVFKEKGIEAWKVFGTPVDCIKVGLSQFVPRRPDLIISGINNGSNHGKNVFYSGTIANTVHGSFHGIPGIAFSHMVREEGEHPPYANTRKYINPIIQHFLQNSIPEKTVISVNFPFLENCEFKGLKFAKQGSSYWNQSVEEIHSSEERKIFRHAATWTHTDDQDQSDTVLLNQGYITITPLRVHDLTDEEFYLQHAHKHLSGVENLFEETP